MNQQMEQLIQQPEILECSVSNFKERLDSYEYSVNELLNDKYAGVSFSILNHSTRPGIDQGMKRLNIDGVQIVLKD